jgi:gluconolactonase
VTLLQTLAAGIGLTESPLWTAEGRLLVVSVSRGLVYEVAIDGSGARPVVDVGGAPSGLAQDATGALWIAQGGSRLRRDPAAYVAPSVQRIVGTEVVRRITEVATDGLTAPNDCAVAANGTLWFTDPAGSPLHGTPEPGRVWTLRPDGTLALQIDDVLYPNGIAFGPEQRFLYVAETAGRRVLRYPCRDGGLGPAETLIELTDGHPDGLAVDAAGNVVVAAVTAGSVIVVDPAGSEIDRIAIGDGAMPTSVCFGGPELATLFVTVAKGGRVLAIPREIPGQRLPSAREGAPAECISTDMS